MIFVTYGRWLVSMKGKSATPVILDTNALLMQFEFKIDLEGELFRILGAYEILIPSAVLNELKKIKDKHAMPALKLAEGYRVIVSEKKGDESILSLAKEIDAVVVTNDRDLRKRLKENGLRAIYLRQKSYLAMDIP